MCTTWHATSFITFFGGEGGIGLIIHWQRGKDRSFMLTCREGPCKNQGHCRSENAIQVAATCTCSEHIHQELRFYNWGSDGLKSKALCNLASFIQNLVTRPYCSTPIPAYVKEDFHHLMQLQIHLFLFHSLQSVFFSLKQRIKEKDYGRNVSWWLRTKNYVVQQIVHQWL